MDVWCVWHVHEQGFDTGDVKFIGVYGSPEDAERAVERLRQKPGFRESLDGFYVGRYEMNRDNWAEGFEVAPVIPGRNTGAKQCVLTIVKRMEKLG